MTLVPNRPTPEGCLLGVEVARMADAAEVEVLAKFPDERPRCRSCAFRAGTVPNGCLATLGDALKCIAEMVPFYCHEAPKGPDGEPETLCAGFIAAMAALPADAKPVRVPWEFDTAGEATATTPEEAPRP